MRMQGNTARVAAVVALALVAAACGGSSPDDGATGAADDDDPAATGDADDEAADGDGAELQLMGWSSSPAEDAALQDLIDAYNESSPNQVTLNLVPEFDTTLQAALAGGAPPDVFYVDSSRLPDLVEAGALQPGGDRIADPDDFHDSLREIFTIDGEFWAPPKDFSTLALQYNVDLLEEAGVEPPTTWEELAAAAEALTTDDQVGLVIGAEYPRWGAFMFQAGGALTTDDFSAATADADANATALEFVAGLFDEGFAATPAELDAGWPGEAFGQGKAAMTIEGNWMVGFMRNDFPDVNWATSELPVGPEGPGTFAFTVAYGVPAEAADPDASWDLVNFLVQADNMLRFTEQFPVLPSRPSIADDWLASNPDLEAYVAGAEYARGFQFVPGFQAVLDVLNAGIQGIAAGDADPATVLAETQQAAEEALG
jgi:multiple sugar transport system substrate-binding protein